MMNKKGLLVLRDIMFMMLIVTSIFIFSGLFIRDMALNYGNTNMTTEWNDNNIDSVGNRTFFNVNSDLDDTSEGLQGGIISLLGGLLTGIGDTLQMVLTAPVSFGNIIASTLTATGMDSSDGTSINTVALIIKYLIAGILYAIIIFSIVSAFLQGGKL